MRIDPIACARTRESALAATLPSLSLLSFSLQTIDILSPMIRSHQLALRGVRIAAPSPSRLHPQLMLHRLASTSLPEHSYQPHPNDGELVSSPSRHGRERVDNTDRSPPTHSSQDPKLSAAPPALLSSASSSPSNRWKPSRPHEQYLLSHPVYTQADVDAVKVVHLAPKTFGDKVARLLVTLSRKGFDFVTRYKVTSFLCYGKPSPFRRADRVSTIAQHASPEEAERAMRDAGKTELSLEDKRKQGYVMTVEQWMSRILFVSLSFSRESD